MIAQLDAVPAPVADRRAGDRREPDSMARDKRGKVMRWGQGDPVPFPVAPKEVFLALKAALSRLPVSYATVVNLSPVQSVSTYKLVATQPTVDPETVRQFVISPDMAARMQKRAKDGRLINLPFVVRVETDPEVVTHWPVLGEWAGDVYFIFDGHHRTSAAVLRGDSAVNCRVATVGKEGILAMAMSAHKGDARQLVRLADSDDEVARVERDDDGIPTAFQVFPVGTVETSKGDFVFDEEAADEVLKFYRDQGNRLSIDYEHMAVTDPPIIAPAAGFFDLQLREDGLWAVDVSWTDKARAMLEAREYCYFSPCFAADKESNRITKLMNVALTNIPATKNMEPLVKSALLVDAAAALVNRKVFDKSDRPAVTSAIARATDEILASARGEADAVQLAAKKARRLATRGYVRGLKAAGFTIQSLIFPKKFWKAKSARKWVKDHDFAPEVDETKSSYRFRQKDPDAFDRLATICLTPGGTKPGDPRCRIKAVGGPIKSKTMVTPTPPAEESLESSETASAAHGKEKPMGLKAKKDSKKATTAADKPADDKDPKKVAASQTAAAETATELADSDSDSGDSGDSGDSVDSAMAMGDSGDSDSGDSDSDSDSSDSDDSAEMAAAADSGDSGDSKDSGDSGDSGDSVDSADAGAVATKKTPLVPDTETPAKQLSGKSKKKGRISLSALVETITGTRSRKEQAGKLMALSESSKQVQKLVERQEATDKAQVEATIRLTVKKAIKKMRLPPSRKDAMIDFGRKYGVEALNVSLANLPKHTVNIEESQGRTSGADPHEAVAVKAEAATASATAGLTSFDYEVIRRMSSVGIPFSKEDFIKTRVAQTTGIAERKDGYDAIDGIVGKTQPSALLPYKQFEELQPCTMKTPVKRFSKLLAYRIADYGSDQDMRRARQIEARQKVESPLHFG